MCRLNFLMHALAGRASWIGVVRSTYACRPTTTYYHIHIDEWWSNAGCLYIEPALLARSRCRRPMHAQSDISCFVWSIPRSTKSTYFLLYVCMVTHQHIQYNNHILHRRRCYWKQYTCCSRNEACMNPASCSCDELLYGVLGSNMFKCLLLHDLGGLMSGIYKNHAYGIASIF